MENSFDIIEEFHVKITCHVLTEMVKMRLKGYFMATIFKIVNCII